MADPLILAFDTSAAHCAAALLRGDAVLAERAEEMAGGQAERLLPMLEEMLAEQGLGWRDLTAIGVGVGPGNFTGVRISVAAARGLALALGIPAVGIAGPEARALGLPQPLAVVEPAPRGQVIAAVDGGAPRLLPAEELASEIGRKPLTGNAASQVAALTGGPMLAPAMPLAVAIARLAGARAHSPQPRPAPLYLRPAEAAPPRAGPPVLLP